MSKSSQIGDSFWLRYLDRNPLLLIVQKLVLSYEENAIMYNRISNTLAVKVPQACKSAKILFIAKASVKIIGDLNRTALFQRSFYLYSFKCFKLRSKRGKEVFWFQCITGEDSGLCVTVLAKEHSVAEKMKTEILQFPIDQLRTFSQNTASGRLGMWSRTSHLKWTHNWGRLLPRNFLSYVLHLVNKISDIKSCFWSSEVHELCHQFYLTGCGTASVFG